MKRVVLGLNIVLLLTPLILGYIFDELVTLGISVSWYLPLSLIFVLFWMWVGYMFASIQIKLAYSYILGNLLTIIAIIFNLSYQIGWSSYSPIYQLSRLHGFALRPLVARITGRINVIFNCEVPISDLWLSHLLLILVFTAGFYCKHKILDKRYRDREKQL